jgi:hypothetical protein
MTNEIRKVIIPVKLSNRKKDDNKTVNINLDNSTDYFFTKEASDKDYSETLEGIKNNSIKKYSLDELFTEWDNMRDASI